MSLSLEVQSESVNNINGHENGRLLPVEGNFFELPEPENPFDRLNEAVTSHRANIQLYREYLFSLPRAITSEDKQEKRILRNTLKSEARKLNRLERFIEYRNDRDGIIRIYKLEMDETAQAARQWGDSSQVKTVAEKRGKSLEKEFGLFTPYKILASYNPNRALNRVIAGKSRIRDEYLKSLVIWDLQERAEGHIKLSTWGSHIIKLPEPKLQETINVNGNGSTSGHDKGHTNGKVRYGDGHFREPHFHTLVKAPLGFAGRLELHGIPLGCKKRFEKCQG